MVMAQSNSSINKTVAGTADSKKSSSKKPANSILLDEVRWKLARIWLIMSGSLFLLLIIQSVMGKYAGKVQNVWGWALPSIMPTLSVIVTVLGAGAIEPDKKEKTKVKKHFYLTVYWLSVVYLSIVLGTVLAEPFTPFDSVELLNLSNFWLGPFQGLVASAMAVLFFTKKARET